MLDQDRPRGGVGPGEPIVVLGGAGYLGSQLVRKLLHEGYPVRVLDAFYYDSGSLRDLLSSQDLFVVNGDLRDEGVAEEVLKGASAVVHLGAIVGDAACRVNPGLATAVNVKATRRIARAAKRAGVRRFIYASSCSVYGRSDAVVDESSPVQALSLYCQTKIEAERALHDLADSSFGPTILRFGSLHGHSPRPRFDLVVNLLAAKASLGETLTIYGGDQWRPFLHIDDAAETVIACLQAPFEQVHNQLFNVGSDEHNLQIGKLGVIIQRQFEGVQLERVEEQDLYSYRVSFAKLRQRLSLEPVRGVEKTCETIREAFAAGRIEDYRPPRYHNAATLRALARD